MVDFTWTRKSRVLLWCTRKSYPDGSPKGLAGRRPSSMARMAKHSSAHAPRSFEFLLFLQSRFFTQLPSFPAPGFRFVEKCVQTKNAATGGRAILGTYSTFPRC